jgi:uncharacterized protein (DUF2141 family)
MKLFLLFVLLSVSSSLKAQFKLEIEITNLRNNEGNIVLELVDENKQTVKGAKGKIENNKCTIVLCDLKDGKYAVQYFHDENSNGVIDKKLIGIPKEGCGFSNNAIGTFGPKEFEEWLFFVPGDKKITIETWYF